MKTDIEKIKKIFHVTGSSQGDDAEPVVSAEDYDYMSHTFTVTRNKIRIGTLTISDIWNDVKEDLDRFLRILIDDGKAEENDILSMTLSSDSEDRNSKEIFAGTITDYGTVL